MENNPFILKKVLDKRFKFEYNELIKNGLCELAHQHN